MDHLAEKFRLVNERIDNIDTRMERIEKTMEQINTSIRINLVTLQDTNDYYKGFYNNVAIKLNSIENKLSATTSVPLKERSLDYKTHPY